MSHCRKVLSVVLSIAVALVVIDASAFAAEPAPRVANVNWFVDGSTVILFYDLEGDSEEAYDVSVVLRRANDPKFEFKPISVAGKIGEGKFVGRKNEVRWSYMSDMKSDIAGGDFYFEVEASRDGGTPWALIAGGVAVGGVVAFLLSSSPTNGDSDSSPKLPFPPPRP